jgi:SWI/SNF-related matrix-associated actin-dependent regulator 1 of chromatin subfamily A
MLWPHQAAAVEELIRHRAYGLWWEPGVGKTAPLAVAGRRVGGRQLWLTKAALRTQAAAEVARFRGDGARIQVVRTQRDWVDPRAQVVVCSYEMARSKPILRQLRKRAWECMVLDEAHGLASPSAVTTQAIYGHKPESDSLARAVPRVWLGTGTPVVNFPNELWTHVSRLWPELCADCPTYAEWIDRFCETRRGDYGTQVVGGADLDELRARWSKTGSRLRLVEAREMPPLTIDTWELEGDALDLSPVPEDLLQQVEDALGRGDDLEALGAPSATLRRLVALGKAGACVERVRVELGGGLDRVIVFGCHIDALRVVARGLTEFDARLVIGDTPGAARDAAVEAFRDGRSRVLVGNVQALGTGLNLQACRRVVFLDASWSPAQNAQAIGRAFRAGQNRPVHVTFASLAGTVDDQVQRSLARKARVLRKLEGNA